METRTIILTLVGIGILGVAGYIGYGMFLMNESTSTMDNTVDSTNTAACEQQLQMLEAQMTSGDTQEIPGDCFQDGTLITDKLSQADPGDKFRKTSNGIEVA